MDDTSRQIALTLGLFISVVGLLEMVAAGVTALIDSWPRRHTAPKIVYGARGVHFYRQRRHSLQHCRLSTGNSITGGEEQQMKIYDFFGCLALASVGFLAAGAIWSGKRIIRFVQK